MMIISPAAVVVVNTVAAAATFVVLTTLASQCGRNMIQTYRIIHNNNNIASLSASSRRRRRRQLPPNIIATANKLSLPSNNSGDNGSNGNNGNNGNNDNDNDNDVDADEELISKIIIDQIKNLNREQLLQLFINDCIAPESELELELVDSEWNGCLLDNNSNIMTIVSNIMTHTLFPGQLWSSFGINNNKKKKENKMKKTKTKILWNGKAFHPGNRGNNRFSITEQMTVTDDDEKKKMKHSNNLNSNSNSNSLLFHKHDFDYSLQKSKFVNDETKSICLKYSKYQSSIFTSLWYTMTDELRYITAADVALDGDADGDSGDNDDDNDDDNDNDTERRRRRSRRCINKNILIGLGSMSWSGGILNCSPFVLWRT